MVIYVYVTVFTQSHLFSPSWSISWNVFSASPSAVLENCLSHNSHFNSGLSPRIHGRLVAFCLSLLICIWYIYGSWKSFPTSTGYAETSTCVHIPFMKQGRVAHVINVIVCNGLFLIAMMQWFFMIAFYAYLGHIFLKSAFRISFSVTGVTTVDLFFLFLHRIPSTLLWSCFNLPQKQYPCMSFWAFAILLCLIISRLSSLIYFLLLVGSSFSQAFLSFPLVWTTSNR